MNLDFICFPPFNMRLKRRLVSLAFIIVNIIIILFLLKSLVQQLKTDTPKTDQPILMKNYSNFESLITVIIRDFEHFEHDVVETVNSFLKTAPSLRILIVSNSLPYPPLQWKSVNYTSVKVINLKLEVGGVKEDRDVLYHIQTKYALFVPDSVRPTARESFITLLKSLDEPNVNILAAPVSEISLSSCQSMDLHLVKWTLTYSTSPSELFCDGVTGKHVLLIGKDVLSKLPDPLMLPFPDSLYIQAKAKNIKTRYLRTVVWASGHPILQSQHHLWKAHRLRHERQQRMYERLAIKRVIRDGKDEWYGCTRDSARCFGTVVGDTPSYLLEGKWTPPCCLNALRTTARHVFKELQAAGVRYWLEGGSLLGAMRSFDILPWDYDVDLGFMREDLPKLTWLLRASKQPVVDTQGFVWEKAPEGDFYRVQFSRSNRLHVDLFPFYNKNGTMTKDTWFPTHKQDREFPAHYLNPLATIPFVGQNVSAPNNIREFLELKFGSGVIENPAYPNPTLLKFPVEMVPTTKPAPDWEY
ncbi:ribitol 5-phosphate transferase FKRP [Frankliniella occidentalis]|uniref:Ribitol 5-phosphate transferase FKRP n=1 Tax=Frankliniella occidentalis TaxID=133901 RepID=A0A6J1SQC3_FRAOC|nr:ribitol 5-phosphate transferase FKRP [Frankliniella occidentalis]